MQHYRDNVATMHSEGVPGVPRAEIAQAMRKDVVTGGVEPFDEDGSIG